MSRSAIQKERAREEWSRALTGVAVVGGLSATLLLFSGCLSSEESETARQSSGVTNHPPVIKAASIMPSPLTRSGPLTVRVEAQDLDLNTLSFRYRWLVNGEIMAGQTQESLPPELLKRGDQVVVEVTPFDGTIVGAPFRSVPSSVVNTAPILSNVLVDLDHHAQGRQALATVDIVDPDQDSVSLTYQWLKNETVVKEGESNTLDLGGLTAKDVIQVNVKASDGNPEGTATASGRFSISNSAPTIVSNPHLVPKGNQFDYLVQATDPDDDSITYALEVAPPGMTIDANTGRIRWGITPDVKGSYQVRVVAKDPQGGFAVQEFELSINATDQA